jgi:hypothetical protein
MKKAFVLLTISASLITLVSFYRPVQEKDNTLSKKEKQQGWKLLFDGASLNGWKSFKGREQDGWAVENGELVCKESGVKKRADLITADMFDNFELLIDWKIAPKHNSGIIYRCTEENGATFESGPEYQLIDDEGYPDKLYDKQLSGANYDMHAPTAKVVKPAGQYNRTRILVKNAHVEHWLNGVKVVEYDFWSPEWENLKANSKWKTVKPYGMSKTGHIALQDHGGGVWFKNIKLRKL